MHVERDLNQIFRNRLANGSSLLVRGVFEQLLTKIVAKGI
jgi:hypothetical protein